MHSWQIVGLILVLAIAFLLTYHYMPKRLRVLPREPYAEAGGSDESDACADMFPPAPETVPPSGYAELETPLVLSSDDNPDTKPTMHLDPRGGGHYDWYSDKRVCSTPWNIPAVSNDTCAAYSIGESVEGPPGHQFCVCEARTKDGEMVPKGSLLSKDVIIAVGAVCTQDSQCCTNYCASVPGQFSKECQCPPGQVWSMETQQCNPGYRPGPPGAASPFSSIYDDRAEAYSPPSAGSALTTGKLCASLEECGLGEACTPDNFCASQIIPDTERDANLFKAGAKCTSSNQCANNLECKNGMCACPLNTLYEFTSRTCQCPSSGDVVYYNGKCVRTRDVPRKFCPSVPPAFASGPESCGIGELWNASTQQCLCVTDLKTIHPGKIGPGGRCTDTSQCESGTCVKNGNISVCVEPDVSLFNIAYNSYQVI